MMLRLHIMLKGCQTTRLLLLYNRGLRVPALSALRTSNLQPIALPWYSCCLPPKCIAERPHDCRYACLTRLQFRLTFSLQEAFHHLIWLSAAREASPPVCVH